MTVPRSPNNTAEAAHDAITRNSSDPSRNIFMKKIQYSCPDGHVLENPNLNNEQTTNISKFDVLCDADRHWRPMLSYNFFPNPPIMPACIGDQISKANKKIQNQLKGIDLCHKL